MILASDDIKLKSIGHQKALATNFKYPTTPAAATMPNTAKTTIPLPPLTSYSFLLASSYLLISSSRCFNFYYCFNSYCSLFLLSSSNYRLLFSLTATVAEAASFSFFSFSSLSMRSFSY
jgi:hypothetical protein